MTTPEDARAEDSPPAEGRTEPAAGLPCQEPGTEAAPAPAEPAAGLDKPVEEAPPAPPSAEDRPPEPEPAAADPEGEPGTPPPEEDLAVTEDAAAAEDTAAIEPPAPAGEAPADSLGPVPPRRPRIFAFIWLLAGACALFAGGAYGLVSGSVPVKQDLAALTAATHLCLAVVVIAFFLFYERSLVRSRNGQLKEALRVLARGSKEPLPAEDPLAAPFIEAAGLVEARMEEAERVIREKTCEEAAVVKAQCEELVENCAQRLHQEKRDTLTALDALRAEHILEAKAWTAGLEREKDARQDAEERRRALEERLARVDLEIAERNAEHGKLTGEVSRLSAEVERLRTQNLKFFDKVAAQLRGSLHLTLKLAAELVEAAGEKGERKGDNVPARFVEQHAGEIQSRVAKLERLIDQIVDLCRVETSTLTLVYSEVDVLSVIKRGLGDLRETAAEKHLNLTFKSPKAMPEIITDARLLTRMLRELLSNAVRFTKRGGRVSVMANVASVNPLGQPVKDSTVEWLRVDVNDTGEGIPATDRERIFTAFERGGEQFGTSDANPGLGLTLTRHYVKLLGGDLLLQSEVGHGSTFSVVLPVKVCVTTQVQ